MKVTTIKNKNIVSLNPLNYSYVYEPWMNVIFTFDCRCVVVANYKQHPLCSTTNYNDHVKNAFVPLEGDHPLCVFRNKLISFGGEPILCGVHILCIMAFLHCESWIGLLVDCVYSLMHVLLGNHNHFSPLH
jgi:hypothetical protein